MKAQIYLSAQKAAQAELAILSKPRSAASQYLSCRGY